MRALTRELEETSRTQARRLKGARVRVSEPPGPCPRCGGEMRVQKTTSRCTKTLELGEVSFTETVHVCRASCRHPAGLLVTQRPQAVRTRVPPGCNLGYDVMVWVGFRRFRDHRQREEIRAELATSYDLDVSGREVDVLAHRFLSYLEALHTRRAPVIRKTLEGDGGWSMHVDATGEDGRGTLLAVLDGWRGWILGAWKIPTEREDQILPHLRQVVARFGGPRSILRDLGRAMIPATKTLAAECGGVPVLSCHQHFLADIGKDLLKAGHDELRDLQRRCNLISNLKAFARGLGRALSGDLPEFRGDLVGWLAQRPRELPSGPTGLAAVRALAQWVYDYAADSTNRRFPFDRPYLDLHRRAHKVRRAIDDFLRRGVPDVQTDKKLRRLGELLDLFLVDERLRVTLRRLEVRVELFERLRSILRLDPLSEENAAEPPDTTAALVELDEIRAELASFVAELEETRPERGPAQDRRDAIDVILQHLKRYQDSLWGHAIPIADEAGVSSIRLVARTNNHLERRFGGLKQGERRRTGRKHLGFVFENLPGEFALTLNLECPDYTRILRGDHPDLAAAFASLDAERIAERQARPAEDAEETENITEPPAIASSAMPREDRGVVRSMDLLACIDAASRSRPPRVNLQGG